MSNVIVAGAGLAGSEAAYRLAEAGHDVLLYEMKPKKRIPAHHTDDFAELCCSNSLRSDRLTNAVGLLKEEMRQLGSLIISCADKARVPAGGALAVDRDGFSRLVTERIRSHKNITVINEELTNIPDAPCIIATGPLTDGAIANEMEALFGPGLHFHDAAAPVVYAESLDMEKVFRASRYDMGDDYLNCPMTMREYYEFIRALTGAETAPLHGFDAPRVFEGCMPVEIMAKRGDKTLAYGPMKPIGLVDMRTGRKPFAVVQLRQDDAEGRLYNMVGFQTNLKFPEQRRVFGMIPGLEHAEYARYGVMHRNTFISSPGRLNWDFSVKGRELLYFAGQMTGVEGYVESAASGLAAAMSMIRKLDGRMPVDFTRRTAIGGLSHYISEYAGSDFQPMNASFGLMEPLDVHIRDKAERNESISKRSLALLSEIIANKM